MRMTHSTLASLFFVAAICVTATHAAPPQEADLAPFLGTPAFETQQVYSQERHPNVAVATDGTVLVTLGNSRLLVRRSGVGGKKRSTCK